MREKAEDKLSEKERQEKMNKQWKVFDELTERCYTDMIRNTVDMVNWNSSFKLLTEIISDGRAGNPDFAKELYLLDDETDYEHDLQGWMEDYLGELEIRERYAGDVLRGRGMPLGYPFPAGVCPGGAGENAGVAEFMQRMDSERTG